MLVSSLHYTPERARCLYRANNKYTPERARRWCWSYIYIWTCKRLVSILWNTNERARRYQWWSSNKYTAELPRRWCRSHNIQLNVQEVGVDHTPYRWTWKRLVSISRYTDECARRCCRSSNKYIAERAIFRCRSYAIQLNLQVVDVDLTIFTNSRTFQSSELLAIEPLLGPRNPDRGREVGHWISSSTQEKPHTLQRRKQRGKKKHTTKARLPVEEEESARHLASWRMRIKARWKSPSRKRISLTPRKVAQLWTLDCAGTLKLTLREMKTEPIPRPETWRTALEREIVDLRSTVQPLGGRP